MTFADVLPHLINGRIAHWHAWDYKLLPDGIQSKIVSNPDAKWVKVNGPLTTNILSSNEWELVPEQKEEPTPTPTPCDSCLKERNELRSQVSNLIIERDLADKRRSDTEIDLYKLAGQLDRANRTIGKIQNLVNPPLFS